MYSNFIKSFVSTDGYRYNLTKPTCFPSGWCCATDAYSLLWFNDPEYINNNDAFRFSNEEGSKEGVNAESVMEPFKHIYENDNSASIGKLLLSDLEKHFEDVKMIPEYSTKYKTCDECDGEGEIECDCCGHVNDCDECNGEGEIECGEEENGHYNYPEDDVFYINGARISFQRARNLLDNLKLINATEVEVFNTDGLRVLFRIPNTKMYILIMGMTEDGQKRREISLHP